MRDPDHHAVVVQARPRNHAVRPAKRLEILDGVVDPYGRTAFAVRQGGPPGRPSVVVDTVGAAQTAAEGSRHDRNVVAWGSRTTTGVRGKITRRRGRCRVATAPGSGK